VGRVKPVSKLYALIIIIVTLNTFTGCGSQVIKANIQDADSIIISYAIQSYAMFSTDASTVKAVAKKLEKLHFQKTGKEMDNGTMYSITFHSDNKPIATYSIDKNNTFRLNGSKECYKIASGTFDYKFIKDIYEKSKENKK
jgi:flagellar motor component MotA